MFAKASRSARAARMGPLRRQRSAGGGTRIDLNYESTLVFLPRHPRQCRPPPMPAVSISPADATSHDPYDFTGRYKWLDERVASYIRIASVSIAAYEYVPWFHHLTYSRTTDHASDSYLLTLPAEWRFYKSQKSWRLSTGCILFILIRYAMPSFAVTVAHGGRLGTLVS